MMFMSTTWQNTPSGNPNQSVFVNLSPKYVRKSQSARRATHRNIKTNGNHNPSAESAKTNVVGFSFAVLSVPLIALDVTTMVIATAAE
jgi:hypothetical protein